MLLSLCCFQYSTQTTFVMCSLRKLTLRWKLKCHCAALKKWYDLIAAICCWLLLTSHSIIYLSAASPCLSRAELRGQRQWEARNLYIMSPDNLHIYKAGKLCHLAETLENKQILIIVSIRCNHHCQTWTDFAGKHKPKDGNHPLSLPHKYFPLDSNSPSSFVALSVIIFALDWMETSISFLLMSVSQ